MTIGLGTNIPADTSADTCNSQAIFCRGDQRVSNTVQYYSPVVNGFSAGVSYGADETRATVGGNRANAYSLSFGGKYVNGGLAVGAGYEHRNDSVATATGLDTDYFAGWRYLRFRHHPGCRLRAQRSGPIPPSPPRSKMASPWPSSNSWAHGAWALPTPGWARKRTVLKATARPSNGFWLLPTTCPSAPAQAYATKLSNNKSANRNFGINPLNGPCPPLVLIRKPSVLASATPSNSSAPWRRS